MVIEEIYDALIEAGASESKASAADRAMTNYGTRTSKIESDINLLKWMVGANIALTVGGVGLLVHLIFDALQRLG